MALTVNSYESKIEPTTDKEALQVIFIFILFTISEAYIPKNTRMTMSNMSETVSWPWLILSNSASRLQNCRKDIEQKNGIMRRNPLYLIEAPGD